jgi:hypothetical protein
VIAGASRCDEQLGRGGLRFVGGAEDAYVRQESPSASSFERSIAA